MKSIILLVILVLISGCTSSPQYVGGKKGKTIADYLDIKRSFNGYYTPNGRAFYLARKGEITQLFMIEKGIDQQLTSGQDGVSSYVVSPKGEQILYLTSQGGSEYYDIYLIDLKSGQQRVLLKNREERCGSINWIDEDQFLYTANKDSKKDFYIYHYSISAKKSKLVVKKAGYNIISDVMNKDDFLFFTYLGNQVTIPYHYKNGVSTVILGADQKRYYTPIGFLKNGDIAMLTNEGQNTIYLSIWNNGTKKDILRDHWSVDEIVVDQFQRDQIIFCKNHQGYSDCYRYNNGKTEKLSIGDGVVTLSHLSKNNLVYSSFQPDIIPTPVRYDLDKKEKQSFGFQDKNGIETAQFVSPILKKVKSFDGEEIPYFLYIPKGHKPPYKTIIYYHGGPEGQFRPFFISTFQYYLKQGYMIVAPNVRGSSGYGQRYQDLDNYKKRMDSVKDARAIMDQVIGEKLAQKGDFVAIGGSYGGFMVVASMAVYPDYFQCGIDSVGVVDFVNFLKNTKSYRRKLREVEYGPLTDPEFLKSISPANMTDKITGKLLVVHGKNDPRVPVTDAYILINNMKKSGKEVDQLIFDDEGHGIRKRSNQVRYYMKGADFIRRCFK